jgi:hypothetical protein
MRLRRSTEILRKMLAQEIKQILGPEREPTDGYRKVQLLVPSTPGVWTWVTETPDRNIALEMGPDRGTYKGPIIPPSTTIDICLLPEQTLWASVDAGAAPITLVVEYWED